MKKIILGAIIAAAGMLPSIATAQATGSFDSSITFMGVPRTLSVYVPPAYTATTAYRLIVGLHGLGDNSGNYRNGLVGALGWPAAIPNTIFVCPEAASVSADFFLPAGDEEVIQAGIDFARAHYNIDTTNIILQGFSLGGRAALRYGLDNYAKFKGLLLTTPAVQGVKDAINENAYFFNYANAPHIPIYITHGEDDIIYESPIDSAYEQLVLHNGVVRYYQFPGLGHAIPPIAGIINFIPFFDTPAVAGRDLDIVKATIAQRSCITALPATCLVRNTGADTIHSVTLSYNAGSGSLSYTWTGVLPSFGHATISLPTITAAAGTHVLDVAVTGLDAGAPDTIAYNNEKIATFQVVTSGSPLPLNEGFEGAFPPANWVQYLAGDVYSPWADDNTVSKTGAASMGTFNTILIFNNSGRREDMATPVLDLTSAAHPQLTFDVAYNYHHYAPPVVTVDTVFADTLEVLISTDCGDTYTSLYKKGGADLATFPMPILNPTSIDADYINPAAANWRTEHIDLNAYAAYDKAIIKFSYISALGGSINIDNVSVGSPGLSVATVAAGGVALYPNPAQDVVHIATGSERLDKINIVDATGRVILTMNNDGNSNEMAISTATMPAGLYVFRVFTGSNVIEKKVVVTK